MDFTLDKYSKLCTALLASGYSIYTVAQYLSRSEQTGKTAVLRHDVDRKPGNAVKMAMREKKLGITSSYYFRMNSAGFRYDIIKAIANMGHEIGYHYEVLDKARGDYRKAIQIFERELAELRKIADVKTICMHGNPLTKWDNRDLWSKYDIKTFGLMGEAYLSFSDITYLSDTGRTWNPKHKIKDWLPSERGHEGQNDIVKSIGCTDELIGLIINGQPETIYLVVHPHRWAKSWIWWSLNFMQDLMINQLKSILVFGKDRVRNS